MFNINTVIWDSWKEVPGCAWGTVNTVKGIYELKTHKTIFFTPLGKESSINVSTSIVSDAERQLVKSFSFKELMSYFVARHQGF